MDSVCQAPWDGVVVHFSGAVYACDSMSQGVEMKKMLLGDLKEQSLLEILEGQKIQELRAALLSGDTEGFLCQTCNKVGTCNLYGDPELGRALQERNNAVSSVVSKSSLSLQRLELGLTDLCNMKCTMCCLSRGEASPPFVPQNGMMGLELATRIIAEFMALAGPNPLILLHWVGEPLIFPKCKELFAELEQYVCRLHLVTNGIKLTEDLVDSLFRLQGEHTLNVSLNAVKTETYQIINQVDKLEEVLNNIDNWLKKRKERNVQNWTFLASTIVLEENYREVPAFVAFWQEKLGPSGSVDIGLNGKGDLSSNQIQILCELDKPLSKVYFREALRLSGLEHLEPTISEWEAVDQVLLGQKKLGDFEAWSVEHLELLLSVEWSDGDLLFLLRQMEGHQERLTSILRRVAFDENRILSELPFPVGEETSQILLWMKLVPSVQQDLSHLLANIEWTEQEVQSVAILLHWYSGFRSLLPKDVDFPRTKDASWAMVQLALGRDCTVVETPLDWQVEALASLISQVDSPELSFQLDINLENTAFSRFLAFASAANIDNLLGCLDCFDAKTPDWLVRATRRRWFFGGNGQADVSFPYGLQFDLLALMVVGREEQGGILLQIRERIGQECVEEIGQALAEVLLKRPDIGSISEWDQLMQKLWRQVSCPLLSFSSSYLLGIAILLKEDQKWGRENNAFFAKNIDYQKLEHWQQKQWEEQGFMLE